jgi:glycosyltransferase involved in cell wall biosynthesis
LERRIVELGLQDSVHCEEATPSAMMPAFYRGLDVLVLPSHSTRRWVEQFGRVLTEAMACGVPVVGSDSGEIPNVIGEAGLIFPEGDADALRERLQHLMDDRELRKRLGNLGRARTLACYTHERIATETERAYRAIRGSSLSVASSVS